MDLSDYRNLFVVCSLVLSFFAITPAISVFVPFYVEERFSELSILGPTQMAEEYPFEVGVNVEERLFVTVNNQMGESSYYMVYVKFRNLTQPMPSSTVPSMLDPLYEFRVFLLSGEKWEGVIRFKFLEVLRRDDVVQVSRMSINNVIFELDSSSGWDSDYSGFYFQLFLELWRYDMASRSFKYHARFVGVWLNMTL